MSFYPAFCRRAEALVSSAGDADGEEEAGERERERDGLAVAKETTF